jgi:hypothetical protein
MSGYDTYDYGARGYYAASGRFMSVDPMAEKYYSISPYSYCAGNPVNAIDIDGKKPVWNGKYGEDSKYIDDVTNEEESWSNVQNYMNYGNYNGSQMLENSNDESSHTITPFRVGEEWLSGKGEKNRTFVNGDFFTELLKKHEHIQSTKEKIAKKISSGQLTGDDSYVLNGIQGVGKYIKDYSILFNIINLRFNW